MNSSVLSTEDVRAFQERGHVRISQAFDPDSALQMQEFMWSELKRLNGIDRNDRSTWTKPVRGLNKAGRHGVYKGIGSPRLFTAIDELLGPSAWKKPAGWGGFLVTFPEGGDRAWDVTTDDWHWDGDPGICVDGASGISVFTFFSQVRPRGGGTLIVEGSHHLVVALFRGLVPNHLGRKHKGLKRHFSRSHPWLEELTGQAGGSHDRCRRFMEEASIVDDVAVRVVELTGEPGDAVLVHPAMYHARSYNRSDTPRFMRVGNVGRHRPIGDDDAAMEPTC
jgi:hypothetical protein